ncbi:MAG: (5-formylfuran-3-yl)methyl phosphate synthase [Candidatus Hydrothermarchaeales archaeon]
MRILISIKDAQEAEAVVGAGGVDIIDVKNPSEGTLGANHPWVIEEVQELISSGTEIAASIGDLDFKPGGASLAAYGVASLGVDYVTASMFRVKPEEVGIMASKLLRTLEDFETGLIIAGYADYKRCGSADPFEFLPSIEGTEYVMLDTAIKDGRNILNFVTVEELVEFKEKAHDMGLKLIIAGSIRYSQLEAVKEIAPDVLGFRGIVCEDGRVKKGLVERLVRELK